MMNKNSSLVKYDFDGTSFHLNRFYELKSDTGYTGSIETSEKEMLSSHSAKRFFGSISIVRVWLFRKVLHFDLPWQRIVLSLTVEFVT